MFQVGERLISFLADLIPSHPHETVAIATHGFVMALLQILLNHEPFENIWQAIPKSGAWLEYQVSAVDLSQMSSRLRVNLITQLHTSSLPLLLGIHPGSQVAYPSLLVQFWCICYATRAR